MDTPNRPTLVLGATGKTGRRVAERLGAMGRPVRLGSRSATPRFDWTDRTTWAPALAGAGAVYIAYQPDLAVPGAVDTVRDFARQAVAGGARRLVLLSGRGEEEAELAEQAIQASGADWTIVRASWFAQNFSETFIVEQVKAGEVALPAGAVPEPFVDADDIADVAVAALTDDRHIGKLYELTGPRALTFAQAVAEVAQAAGRPIAYREIAAEDYAKQLAGFGLPAVEVDLVTYLFTTVLDGRNSRPTDGVRRALGCEPRDFSAYARAAAAAGAWIAQPR